jgi:hypothetical protein
VGEGNRTLVFNLDIFEFPQCFQHPFRHFAGSSGDEITTGFLFVGMVLRASRAIAEKNGASAQHARPTTIQGNGVAVEPRMQTVAAKPMLAAASSSQRIVK